MILQSIFKSSCAVTITSRSFFARSLRRPCLVAFPAFSSFAFPIGNLRVLSLSRSASSLAGRFYGPKTNRLLSIGASLRRMMSTEKARKEPAVPRPSSSVILISPTNEILLLHRVSTSSSFASAHVFPGGNVDTFHDGEPCAPDHPGRHIDSETYRLAAIRETFEESGILLAHDQDGRLIEIPDEEREAGRRQIHDSKVSFPEWLKRYGAVADTKNLIPFTRWVTPAPLPKRFTTQMYLYFLPLSSSNSKNSALASNDNNNSSTSKEIVIPTPTSDGGLEHTAAQFLNAEEWLSKSRDNQIILYPPQFTLLYLCAQFLKTLPPSSFSTEKVLQSQRDELMNFVKGGTPLWRDVVICPQGVGKVSDGRMVMRLDCLPPELVGSDREGCRDFVVLVRPSKAGFRELEVRRSAEVVDGVLGDEGKERGRREAKL